MPRIDLLMRIGELAQHVVAGVVAVAVVDRLEVVDVEHQHGQRLAARGRLLDQRAEVAFHVAAVVEAGERVGDRHLDRHLHVVAQPLGVALLADLGAHARQQLVLVDRPHQIVVDADLEPAHAAAYCSRRRRSPGSARCACARASAPGCTAAGRRNSRGRARRSAGRSRPRRRGTAPRCGSASMSTVCSRGEHAGDALGGGRAGRRRSGCGRRGRSRRPPRAPGSSMPISREVTARMRSSSVIIFSRDERAHARDQRDVGHRLGEEIVGAGLEPAARGRTAGRAR